MGIMSARSRTLPTSVVEQKMSFHEAEPVSISELARLLAGEEV